MYGLTEQVDELEYAGVGPPRSCPIVALSWRVGRRGSRQSDLVEGLGHSSVGREMLLPGGMDIKEREVDVHFVA